MVKICWVIKVSFIYFEIKPQLGYLMRSRLFQVNWGPNSYGKDLYIVKLTMDFYKFPYISDITQPLPYYIVVGN